jgi:menaquinol-cytochrome c reductase iron-sulfur subunit
MEDSPSCLCCRKSEDRRGFFGKIAAIVFGVPALTAPAVAAVVAFLNPLGQKSQGGRFRRLASIEAIPADGTPLRVPVVADRTDAWNRFPEEPIGAVFLHRDGARVTALQTLCPHAGCEIGFDTSGRKFFCPCHSASFNLAGARTDADSPSPRDMDSLEVEIRNRSEVWVKFQSFAGGTAEKIALG